MTAALYALSADPVTNGHLWVIEQAHKIFDRLIVALGDNPEKKYYFSSEDRYGMLRGAISHGLSNETNNHKIEVCNLDPQDFAVRVAHELGCQYLVRGVRSIVDFEHEMNLANINRKLEPLVETVFLPTPPELATISSTMVRGMFGLRGWETEVRKLVPPSVLECIIFIRGNHGK